MIIPTAEFDPFFARDGVPFREKMCRYIEREFSDLLGGLPADTFVQPADANHEPSLRIRSAVPCQNSAKPAPAAHKAA